MNKFLNNIFQPIICCFFGTAEEEHDEAPQLLIRRSTRIANNHSKAQRQKIIVLKGKYPKSGIIETIEQRRALSVYLFKNNKRSDEYYTRACTWKRFIEEHNLNGQKVFEPFYGDGSSMKVLNELGVEVESKRGDFWDIITDKNCSKEFIMSNPPFSFKWLIIQTLLEKKQSFALIMPFQIFYNSSLNQLNNYQKHFGGTWSKYILSSKEQHYYSLKDKKMVKIGTSILKWIF